MTSTSPGLWCTITGRPSGWWPYFDILRCYLHDVLLANCFTEPHGTLRKGCESHYVGLYVYLEIHVQCLFIFWLVNMLSIFCVPWLHLAPCMHPASPWTCYGSTDVHATGNRKSQSSSSLPHWLGIPVLHQLCLRPLLPHELITSVQLSSGTEVSLHRYSGGWGPHWWSHTPAHMITCPA